MIFLCIGYNISVIILIINNGKTMEVKILVNTKLGLDDYLVETKSLINFIIGRYSDDKNKIIFLLKFKYDLSNNLFDIYQIGYTHIEDISILENSTNDYLEHQFLERLFPSNFIFKISDIIKDHINNIPIEQIVKQIAEYHFKDRKLYKLFDFK